MAGKKKKLLTSVVALATAAALVLGGTFAWQSINQTALNEASDVVNPGGRLHDDFNGENKDVYVENFADEDIFARIRLGEFFEITQAGSTVHSIAGSRDEDGNVAEYELHDFYNKNDTDDYWNWKTGGSTVFMPTFNKNKDSLVADINGTYNGLDGIVTNEATDDRYSDYIQYVYGEEKTSDAIYDYDSNSADELGANLNDFASYPDNVTTVNEKHTAKYTSDAKLISMDDWMTMIEENGGEYDAKLHGNYWVYDEDGWVYWSAPIKPGEATGLLLDGISLDKKMDDSWYYAINVIAQFITADDLGKKDNTGFYDTENGTVPSDKALDLLEKIGVKVGEAEVAPTPQTLELVLNWDGTAEVAARPGDYIILSIDPEEEEDAGDLSSVFIEGLEEGEDYTYDPETHTLVILAEDIPGAKVYDANGDFSGWVIFGELFEPKSGTLRGTNMSLYSDCDYINVDEETNTLMVKPIGEWKQIEVLMDDESVEFHEMDKAVFLLNSDGEFEETSEDYVDILYYTNNYGENLVDILCVDDAAGTYKITASIEKEDGTKVEAEIVFHITVYEYPNLEEDEDEDREEPYITYTLANIDDTYCYRLGNVLCRGSYLYVDVFNEDGSPISWDGVKVCDDEGNDYSYTTEGIDTHWDWDDENEITPQAKIFIPENTPLGEIRLNIELPDDGGVYFIYVRVIQPWEIALTRYVGDEEDGEWEEYYRGDTIPEGEYGIGLCYSEYDSTSYPQGPITITYFDENGDIIGEPERYEKDDFSSITLTKGNAEYFILTHTVEEGSPLNYEGKFYIDYDWSNDDDDDEGGDVHPFQPGLYVSHDGSEDNVVTGGEWIIFSAYVLNEDEEVVIETKDMDFTLKLFDADGNAVEVQTGEVTKNGITSTFMMDNNLFVDTNILSKEIAKIRVTVSCEDGNMSYENYRDFSVGVVEEPLTISAMLNNDQLYTSIYDKDTYWVRRMDVSNDQYQFSAKLNGASANVTWSFGEVPDPDADKYYTVEESEDGEWEIAYSAEEYANQWAEITLEIGTSLAKLNKKTGEMQILLTGDNIPGNIRFFIEAHEAESDLTVGKELMIVYNPVVFQAYNANVDPDAMDSHVAYITKGEESIVRVKFDLTEKDQPVTITEETIKDLGMYCGSYSPGCEFVPVEGYTVTFEGNGVWEFKFTVPEDAEASEFFVFGKYNYGTNTTFAPNGYYTTDLSILTEKPEVVGIEGVEIDYVSADTYIPGKFTKIYLRARAYDSTGDDYYGANYSWGASINGVPQPDGIKMVKADTSSPELWIFGLTEGEIKVNVLVMEADNSEVKAEYSIIITGQEPDATE